MAESVKAPVAKTTLPKNIFDVEVNNHELLKLAYDSFLANSRSAHATTKKRGEVSGGGIKPWKQKGTGRARFGSSRNPIWRGGGIAFGPNGTENHKLKLSTTSKHVALRQALTLANKDKKIVVLDFKTTGKTSEAAKFLMTNKLERRVLLVVDEKTPQILRATNNIQNLLLIRANYLSVYHILNADKIVLTPKSIDVIKTWLTKEVK
jgi:large subunit ribosomal protein L4